MMATGTSACAGAVDWTNAKPTITAVTNQPRMMIAVSTQQLRPSLALGSVSNRKIKPKKLGLSPEQGRFSGSFAHRVAEWK
jgi:hypothetical protein